MKSVFKVSLLAAAVVLANGCKDENVNTQATATNQATIQFENADQKSAYAIGSSLGSYLKARLTQQSDLGVNLENKYILAGVNDSFNGNLQLNEEQIKTTLQDLDKRVQKLAQEKQKKEMEKAKLVAQTNKAKGDKFRAEFAKQKGVVTLKSGLMYLPEVMGKGEHPKAEDTVKVQYKGELIDGTKFDSSYDRKKPATFPLNRVIPGWTEGLQHMSVGSKFKFVIPPELAYGEHASGPIPGNSTLVFEVELLDIEKAATVKKAEVKKAEVKKAPEAAVKDTKTTDK